MAGDIKAKYGTGSTLAFTSSQSLAVSSSLTTGAFSAEVDNSSTLAKGYMISAKAKSGAVAGATGTLALYCWGAAADSAGSIIRPSLGDTTGAAVSGSDSTGSWGTANSLRAGAMPFGAVTTDSSTASRTYPLGSYDIASLFNTIPVRFGFYAAVSAGATAALDSTATAITIVATPILEQYT